MIRQYFYSFVGMYSIGLVYCLVSERLRHVKKIEQQKKDREELYKSHGISRPPGTFL